MAHQFSEVIVCELPDSYATAALGLTEKVDMVEARRQWESYVSALAGLGCRVTRLPPLERFPDCVFVEDTAVIVLGHALLTRPGDPSRREEIQAMRPVLQRAGLVVMQVSGAASSGCAAPPADHRPGGPAGRRGRGLHRPRDSSRALQPY